MLVDFLKMHGAGNDFVVLDAFAHPALLANNIDFSELAQVLCARHFGVGSDGLLMLQPSQHADARMRMWNPDGTEDMCGNGLRCVAWLFRERGYATKGTFTLETIAGIRTATQLPDQSMQVEMGKARWELRDIPMNPPKSTFGEFAVEYDLPLQTVSSHKEIISHVTSLSTGTTHSVIFTEELPADTDFEKLAPLIERHPWFPERTTALWAKVHSPENIQIRIWERGAGETLACGTGACAVAAAAWRTGRSDAPEIAVHSKGGVLRVSQNAAGELLLAGDVQLVFEGKIAVASSLKE